MNKELNIQKLNGEELWKYLYNKELNTKKTILEYIEITKVLKKENVSPEKLQETYNFIYYSIEKLRKTIKPNTIMYLQNQLKSQYGKLIKDINPKKESSFIKYFKEAYPERERRKDFTWVLMDINSITEEQIWTTLVHINKGLLKENIILTNDEKVEIINLIKKLIQKNNIKYINKVKSLNTLLNNLNIRIVKTKKAFVIKRE